VAKTVGDRDSRKRERAALANGRANGASPARKALPRGPQALPRQEVAEDQRQRLFQAMVEAVNERGFTATTISDLVARAGISRRSFYEHFENKDECLLGAFDASVQTLTQRLVDTYRPDDDWPKQVEAAIQALFDATVNRPDAARLICVEIAAAGEPGIKRWAAGVNRFERFLSAVFEQAPGPGTIPDPVAKAFAGAMRKILYTRVLSTQSSRALRSELNKLVPDLVSWISTYYPSPPGILHTPRPRRPVKGRSGRAPGTLAARSSSGPRGLPRGEHNLPRGFVAHNQRERIFDAIANITAAKGYGALGLESIAAEAAISLQTFYAHFENKEEAFLATYEVGHGRAVGVVHEAFAAQDSWPQGIRAATEALFEFLAAEPSYARLACVDILIAFPHVAGRVQDANSSYAELLDFRFDDGRPYSPPPIVNEAIVGAIFELLHDYILRGRTSHLPELADHANYIALTPFIGSEAALETIASGK
jgi:AcrR family transcriptional regulator